jgi:hypothetical protein
VRGAHGDGGTRTGDRIGESGRVEIEPVAHAAWGFGGLSFVSSFSMKFQISDVCCFCHGPN